jgi:hypothetical protein
MSKKKDLAFIGPPISTSTRKGPSAKSISSASNKFKPVENNMVDIKSAANMAATAWNSASPELKASIKSGGKKVAEKVAGKVNFAGTSGSGFNHSSGYALSKAPNPRVISLDTGITPNTYVSDQMSAVENVCSPLHMTSAIIQIPTYTSTLNTDFVNNTVFNLQMIVQDIISYKLNITTEFNATQLLTGLNSLLYAFQIYYYYKSILSYRSEPTNQNEGMIYLRQQITAQMIEDLSMLEDKLRFMPLPPKMNDFVRYFMGNFYSSVNQGSTMLKINPSLGSITQVNASDITNALSLLAASTDIYIQMRKAIPTWRQSTLYDVEPVPIYDANFLTIFANLPFKWYAGTNNIVPTVTTDDTAIPYNSYTNVLDGGAFASTSIYNSTTANWFPGLIQPPVGSVGATAGNTRRSFYSVGGVKQFYQVSGYPFLIRSRQETTTTNDAATATISAHLSGSETCKIVNIGTLTETTLKFFDYLMSWDTISKEKVSGFNRNVLDSTAKSQSRNRR